METRVAVIAVIVENEDAVTELNALLHQYGMYIIGRMGVPTAPGREHHLRGAGCATGRDLRPQREDRAAGGCQRQDAVLQRDHTDRRQIGMLHDSFV